MNKIFTLMLLSFSSQIFASVISVDTPIINFDKNENGSRNITVKNHSNFTGYVKVDLYEILNAGTKDEEIFIYKQIDRESPEGKYEIEKYKNRNIQIKSPENSDLYFSPSKIILEKSGSHLDSQTIRVVNVNKELKDERIYRLRVYPVIDGFGKKNKKMGIKILMGYESLVLIQSNNPKLNYSYKIIDKKMIIKNEGNDNIKFESGEHCNDSKKCELLAPFRLYNNTSEEISLPFSNGVVKFLLIFGNKKETITFNLNE
jgi:hypothetical protein